MNKQKYTPAPWFNKGKRVFWQQPDRNLPKDNLFNGLVCICATTEDNPPEVIEEAHANATLISAAPEMAELLMEILGEIELDEISVKDRPSSFLKIVKVLDRAGINVMERKDAN